MNIVSYVKDLWNAEPQPRTPSVYRMLFAVGWVGAPSEMVLAYLRDELTLVGVLIRITITLLSIYSFSQTFRPERTKQRFPSLAFSFLILIIIQICYQSYVTSFRLDFAVLLYVVYATGAIFISSPRQILAYTLSVSLIATTAIIITPIEHDIKFRLLAILFYISLTALAVFAFNFRLGQQLKSANERFKVLADFSTDIIALHDRLGLIKYISPSSERLTGFHESELLGKDAMVFVHPDDQLSARETYVKLFMPPHVPVQLEYRLLRKDGSYFWVEAIGTPVLEGDNKISGIVTTTRNISRRKQIEEDRLAKTMELTRINRELDQFAYIVSHDLKAPLRGISALTGFIEEDLGSLEVSPEVKHHLVLMRSRTKRLEQLINDILAYSRAGRARADAETIDSKAFFADLIDMLALPAGYKVHMYGQFPVFRATRIYMEQVFSNLIYNAYRHHDQLEGNIQVACERVSGGWNFMVSDDGPGIPENERERIFEVFAQLNSSDTNEGTGIGLAVVRKIMDTIGGQVTVSTNEPRGTTFTVFWPDMPANL